MPKIWYVVVAGVVLLTFLAPRSAAMLSLDHSSHQGNSCELPSGSNVCAYINKQCDPSYFLIAKLYYCAHSPSLPLLILVSLGILVCLVVVLTSLSVVVSNFLFRNLNELTTTFRINNKILSFILIPLTNTFSDLINYYVVFDSGAPNLVLGQLVGSILIMFTVIIGMICILTSPYNVQRHNMLLVDFLWVLFVLVVFIYILSDSKITLLECLFMICCYGAYILFLNYYEKDKIDRATDNFIISPTNSNQEHAYNIEDALDILSDDECPKSPAGFEYSQSTDTEYFEQSFPDNSLPLPRGMSRPVSPISSPVPAFTDRSPGRSTETLIPHDSVGLLQIIFSVLNVFFSVLIPVNYTKSEIDMLKSTFTKVDVLGLIKLWFSFEIPLLINYQFLHIKLLNFIPIILLNVIGVHLLSISVSYKGKVASIIINFLGVLTSIIVLSNISVLVLQILKNFGLLWKMSDYLLGLFVFSISNSITDIITNITISTKIEPILGINACLGTPILMILLGIGVNGFLAITKSETHSPLEFTLKPDMIISTLALTVIVAFYLIYLPLNGWVFDKRAGAFALSWYFLVTGLNFYLEK